MICPLIRHIYILSPDRDARGDFFDLIFQSISLKHCGREERLTSGNSLGVEWSKPRSFLSDLLIRLELTAN